MTVLPAIAAKLATALRNTPCTCVVVGSWPLFKAEAKAFKPKTCQRCDAIAAYDAFVSIVQVPAVPAKDVPNGR